MKYVRVIVNNADINHLVETYGLFKDSDYEFSDLIYLNKNGASITEDTVKIRIYKNNTKEDNNTIIIKKETVFEDGLKDDETIFRKELDTEEEATEYVENNFKDYKYEFKLLKKGTLYTSDDLSISFEEVYGIGKSIEVGGFDNNLIREVLEKLDVVEKLNVSLPEYAYNKFVSNKVE